MIEYFNLLKDIHPRQKMRYSFCNFIPSFVLHTFESVSIQNLDWRDHCLTEYNLGFLDTTLYRQLFWTLQVSVKLSTQTFFLLNTDISSCLVIVSISF